VNTAVLDGAVQHPDQPDVTALMVVGRMPQWQVQLAVNCFANQTYPNRELVIINNARTQFQASGLDLVLPVDPTRQRPMAHVIDSEQEMTAGMCRNYAVSAAGSDVLVQWDAHCWHSPYRIEKQLEGLLKHQAHICMLTHALEYSYGNGLATYWSTRKKIIPNSMMFLRSKSDDYADVDKAEEVSLLLKLIQSGYKPIALDRPELLCRMHYSARGRVKRPVAYQGDPPSKPHMKLLRGVVKLQALGG
jgi:hypothetical protein